MSRAQKLIVGLFLLLAIPLIAYIVKPSVVEKFVRTGPTTTSNVLYPLVYDASGRDIYYYTFSEDGKHGSVPFAGVGVVPVYQFNKSKLKKNSSVYDITTVKTDGSLYEWTEANAESVELLNKDVVISPQDITSTKMTKYIVGTFEKWEPVPGSVDKYMTLNNPTYVRDTNGHQFPYPKIRIGFGSTTDGASEFATMLHVEDLSKIIPVFDVSQKIAPSYALGKIGSFSSNTFGKILSPGDTVAVKVYLDVVNSKDFTDSTNAKVASDLFIRRFNPAVAIEKEAGIHLSK